MRFVSAVRLLAVALGACSASSPSSWDIPASSRRSRCTVARSSDRATVERTCGLPDWIGLQLKVGDPKPQITPTFCSAPGYVYGDTAVLFGCDELVFDVRPLKEARVERPEHIVNKPPPQPVTGGKK